MGRKAKPRFNTENDNSLSQLIKNLTNKDKSKSFIQPGLKTSNNSQNKHQHGYSKYLNEYERFE